MHLEWYSRGWLAVAILPAVLGVPMAQDRAAPPASGPASSPKPAGLPFNMRDAAVGAVMGFVPAAIGMRIMAVQHQKAIAGVQAEFKATASAQEALREGMNDHREQQHERMNRLQSQIGQVGQDLDSTKREVSGLQTNLRTTENLARPVRERVAGLELEMDDHAGSLRRVRDAIQDLALHIQPVQAQALRGILAAHEELWVCVEENLKLIPDTTIVIRCYRDQRYHGGYYMIPINLWREAVSRCHDKPGWTPDLELGSSIISTVIQYVPRRSRSSSSSSTSAPSPFAKAQVATSHFLAHTAHAGHRFFSQVHGAALMRAAVKVEKAAPPVWARVAE
ncbi:MAG: hypothetical protein M1826_000290 [Phylliscum demangeonii]|nr:MAG: hypothetical protein M1826_000290 [Phylliscum demangeonii]